MNNILQDDYVSCPMCGCRTFTKKTIYYLEKKNDKYLEHINSYIYKCESCGQESPIIKAYNVSSVIDTKF